MLCNVNFTFSFILIYLLLGLRSRYSKLIQRIKVDSDISIKSYLLTFFFQIFNIHMHNNLFQLNCIHEAPTV